MTEKKLSVLFIEDDAFLAQIYTKAFEDYGLDVSLMGNCEDGIKFLSREKPDIIILDLLLPTMNGFEFIEQVRANEIWRDIPILVLSNLGQHDDVVRARQLGADAYMIKAHALPQEVINKIRSLT
ncbi:MAG: response regulator transcription factor [Patescibacteria group bacterium]